MTMSWLPKVKIVRGKPYKAIPSGMTPPIIVESVPITSGLFVATTGNDTTGDGSIHNPWRTINKGITELTSGGTLWIRGGTYSEALFNNVPSGTSWTAKTLISGYPGETVIVNGSSGWALIQLEGAYQYIEFADFIADAVNAARFGIQFGGGAHHVRLRNIELRNAPFTGILLLSTSGVGHELINVNAHANGFSDTGEGSHGVYCQSDGVLIDGGQYYNNDGYGVQVYVIGARADNAIVRNTRVYSNGRPGHGGGMIISSGDNHLVYNNLVYSNGSLGINSGHNGTVGMKFYNNTIYGNAAQGLVIGSGGSGTIVRNNIVFSNGSAISDFGSGSTLSHNLTTDPSFVNAGAADFHLQSGSAARDAGVTLSDVTVDHDDVARPQGAAYCIGAYEFI